MLRGYPKHLRAVALSTVVLACLVVGFLNPKAGIGSEAHEDENIRPHIQSTVITSKTVKVLKQAQDAEAKGIYEGNVNFEYAKPNGVLKFRSNKLVTYVLTQARMLRRVEMFGGVSMQKGEWSIHSKEASSDNLNAYVDFSGDVTVRRSYEVIGTDLKSIRFDTLANTISSRD